MPTDPDRSDAWLLLALVGGKGDPEATLALADHLNAAIPTFGEWTHACAALGERGLIEANEPLPRPTKAGTALSNRLSGGNPSRATPDHLLDALRDLPVVATPLAPPDPAVLTEAAQSLRRRFERRWDDERNGSRPRFRDAWLLTSLHLERGIDWRSVSTGDEDGPAIPTDADWSHAVGVLSKRGLIAIEEETIQMTPVGGLLVEGCSAVTRTPFQEVLCVLDGIKRAQPESAVASVPSAQALRRLERRLGWV